MRFDKPCTSVASKSEFGHANRTLCLKVGLHSFKIIKISRLTIDRLAILWSLCYCETDCASFLSLDTQNVERGQLRWAQNYIQNPEFFNYAYPIRVLAPEFFCLCRTESARMYLK